ncbi:hypothetical protein SAMN02745671_01690 [Anaerovibrio lipolyticus DSM 3074]|uniref:Peptidase n=2 Tax=Anaerovibrio lipolyticus TaxID=82374 RepID=A0A0B2JY82_9FIRM|nr:hypothetical protein [Anaerovibrio lipolyticus]KHM51606.1 hypothetical protein NZ47_09485 [Anaerovibrio lipolyticus]SHI78891.1 hypothetical protein SAMN02745671_01690 [Anaerovibrio lipolyticus DSM 3074]
MSDEANTTTNETEDKGLLSAGSEENQDKTSEDKGLLSGDGDGGEDKAAEDNQNTESKEDQKEKEGTEEEKKESSNAPEKYEDFKVPEGFTFNEEALGEYKDLAKELDLSQEKAQKLVDYQVKLMQKQRDNLDEFAKKEAATWKAETKKAFSDKEIADAVRGFKSAPQDVQDMLAACGFENHKSFVEFFMHVGRSIKEDKFEEGKPGGKVEKSAASVLYPEL